MFTQNSWLHLINMFLHCKLCAISWLFFFHMSTSFFLLLMGSILASSAICLGLSLSLVQSKDYKISIRWFSPKHKTLRSKNIDRLAQNQDNMSEWSYMSTHGLLFQWASTIKIHQSMFFGLAQSIHHQLLEITCSRYNIAEILLTRRSTTITCPLYRLLQLIVYIYIYICVLLKFQLDQSSPVVRLILRQQL